MKTLSPQVWLIVAVGYGLTLVALIPELPLILGLDSLGRWFLDSYALLAASDATRLGLDPWHANPLDIIGRAHVYSPWWLGLRYLGFTRDHNFLLGGLSIGLFLVVALGGLRPRTLGEALLIAAVILSPPFLLAFNRANNDLLIFALLGAGLLLIRTTAETWRWCGLGLAIVLATGLKYYPIVAVAAPGLVIRPARRMLLITCATGLAALGCLGLVATTAPTALLNMPASLYLFGATELTRDLGLGPTLVTVLGASILFVMGCGLALAGVTRGLGDETCGPARQRAMFAVAALLLTGCFVAGTNYAYRWIFALWLWPWLWTQAPNRVGGRAARAALGLLLVSLWADGVFCLATNLYARLHPEQLESAQNYWRYCTQPLVWLLMGLLAGWLIEALWTTIQALRDELQPGRRSLRAAEENTRPTTPVV